ncbi:MAG: inositol monophosphatase, partial [Lachnospiraceae bacterium]|nr:inositol monophosphatase [Lachnospiraceae bacterium]
MSRITEDTKKKIMDLAKEAGGILLHAQEIEKTVEEKSGRANFVTAYDKKVQAFLFESLKEILPRAVLIGEEEETHA